MTSRLDRIRLTLIAFSVCCVVVLPGCFHIAHFNPDYPATAAEVRAEAKRMRAEPTTLDRPVIVLSGYRGPSAYVGTLRSSLKSMVGLPDERGGYVAPNVNRMLTLGFAADGSLESAARRTVAFVEEHYPSDDPASTREVDVVALSMGGLVARLAAADPSLRDQPDGKRLNIRTLYTLGTPHRGASLADDLSPDKASREMRAGSDILTALDKELEHAGYEIVPYAALKDGIVGATNAAPTGRQPIWVPGRFFGSHLFIARDKRIQVDIALRLRGESPLGQPSEPPSD